MKHDIRQGDVRLVPVDSLPASAKEVKGKVLQESETTGHHHHFRPDAPVRIYQTKEQPDPAARTITPDLGKFIVVDDVTLLYHGKGFDPQPALRGLGDHHALTINPGIYRIDIKREYDYSRKMARKVVD
jgi:hypothetical protein